MIRGRVSMSVREAKRLEVRIGGLRFRMEPNLHRFLEILLLAGPRIIEWDELIEALWPNPDVQPLGAQRLLHVYVYRLRQAGAPIDCHARRGLEIAKEWRGRDPLVSHSVLKVENTGRMFTQFKKAA